ncbi:MAG: ABC transporter substrate-binding protein [Clostridiales bacterium]|nr:ABC transporter substrate-binding protein [Clostridiales bacterium]
MLKPKLLITTALLALVTIVAGACGDNSAYGDNTVDNENTLQSQYSYTFTDSSGTSITLTEKPETVAILFSSYADIWAKSGGTVDITVGEAIERGFADNGVILVDPSAGHSTIDLETLVNAEPDLVIGTADYVCQSEAVEFCREAGINAAMFKVESVDDYLNMLKICCEINGQPENYKLYGEEIKANIDSMLAEVNSYLKNDSIVPPSILFVRAGSSDKSTKAKTAADNFVCAMLDELGVNNIADEAGELVGNLSLEVILEKNPDCMFITTMGDERAATEHMTEKLQSDGWRELDCVKNNNCYFIPKDLFHFKPNSRWDEAYRYLIDLLYPGLLSE